MRQGLFLRERSSLAFLERQMAVSGMIYPHILVV